MPTKSSSKQNTSTVISYTAVVLIIIVVLIALIYVYKAQQLANLAPEELQTSKTSLSIKSAPTPTPTPTKLLHGKETYHVSGGPPDAPQLSAVTIDPLDPAVGTVQAISVNMASKYPVKTAFVTIRTDTKSTKIPLTLTSGINTNGTWQASWTVPETYLYTYLITPTAQTDYNQTVDQITIRQQQ